MDAATAQKIVSALDAELGRRRQRRNALHLAQWLEEEEHDYGALEVACRSVLARLERGDVLPDVLSEPVDPDEAIRREEFLAAHGGIEGLIDEIAESARILKGRDQGLENAKNGIRPSYANRVRVRSMARLLADVKPKLDPSAPRPAERTGRRGEAPVEASGPPIDGVWQLGMIQSFNPRTHQGSVRGRDGTEYPLGPMVLMNSGLVTLVIGMRCQFRVIAGEVEIIKSAWH
jgi:hypothetical protein